MESEPDLRLLNKNDAVLIHPENYYTIPFSEDRLFIAAQHVPLFIETGWEKQPNP